MSVEPPSLRLGYGPALRSLVLKNQATIKVRWIVLERSARSEDEKVGDVDIHPILLPCEAMSARIPVVEGGGGRTR